MEVDNAPTSLTARPTVTVYDGSSDGSAVIKTVSLPPVFVSPIRPDIVGFVYTNIAKNSRQAYAVQFDAGEQTSGESWGTGRAVARIPRIPGGGTHRSGQGAFGNMCRGGRMYSPNRIWRKWHRHVNLNQRRYAIASALAASAIPSFVMARGHRIDEVPEVPLVIGGAIEEIKKTKDALALLKRFGASADVEKAADSKKIHRGKGKARNRRYRMRRGPLIVYDGKNKSIEQSFRNLPGVELASVYKLNLLQLAPGGHLGRFVVWTQKAFESIEKVYNELKTGYVLPRPIISNSDITRIINSEEIQKVCRKKKGSRKEFKNANPYRNFKAMVRLNPYAAVHRKAEAKLAKERAEKKKELAAKKREKTADDKRDAKKEPISEEKAAMIKKRKEDCKKRNAFLKSLMAE